MSTAEHANRPKDLAVHFESFEQQYASTKLGMWLFLGTELLFFAGLFCAYAVYRGNHQLMFHYAQYFLDWKLGGTNTLVLIASSLTAALSVRFAQLEKKGPLLLMLAMTFMFAGVFMVIKYFEYSHKLHIGVGWGTGFDVANNADLPAALRDLGVTNEQLKGLGVGTFFAIYFCMTGLHGFHVLIGMGLYIYLIVRALRGNFHKNNFAAVDNVALYWHIVDIIWIFLFPMLYLIG